MVGCDFANILRQAFPFRHRKKNRERYHRFRCGGRTAKGPAGNGRSNERLTPADAVSEVPDTKQPPGKCNGRAVVLYLAGTGQVFPPASLPQTAASR